MNDNMVKSGAWFLKLDVQLDYSLKLISLGQVVYTLKPYN